MATIWIITHPEQHLAWQHTTFNRDIETIPLSIQKMEEGLWKEFVNKNRLLLYQLKLRWQTHTSFLRKRSYLTRFYIILRKDNQLFDKRCSSAYGNIRRTIRYRYSEYRYTKQPYTRLKLYIGINEPSVCSDPSILYSEQSQQCQTMQQYTRNEQRMIR